jgi:hypothetical protein
VVRRPGHSEQPERSGCQTAGRALIKANRTVLTAVRGPSIFICGMADEKNSSELPDSDFYNVSIEQLLFPEEPPDKCPSYAVCCFDNFEVLGYCSNKLYGVQNSMSEVEYLSRCQENVLAEYWVITDLVEKMLTVLSLICFESILVRQSCPKYSKVKFQTQDGYWKRMENQRL